MSSAADHRYMARALQLARHGLFTSDPNPRVGCVLVKDKRIVGEGFHARAGMAHAEINALEGAGAEARGAVAYVTLEPCCHHGRTPPCAEALIAAGIARVVVAMTDPNPRVAGQGLAALREADIPVCCGVAALEARALNPGFVSRMARGRPWVRVKAATSLDGRTALANGESRWVTGAPARADVHRLRARSAAVMTGRGTLVADNPALNVRLEPQALGIEPPVRQPLRVVLDTNLQVAPEHRLLNVPGPCVIVTARVDSERLQALRSAGAEVLEVPRSQGGVDLHCVMRRLAERGVNEVQVEAGPTLCGALASHGLVDEWVIYMAPHLIGDTGRGLASLPDVQTMPERLDLRLIDVRQIGSDLRITAVPQTDETRL